MVTLEDVKYVARLARLSFTADEEEHMVRDLSSILGYMRQLEEVDTSEVAPMEHVLDRVDVFREDVIVSRITQAEALSNAPDTDGDYFRVPRVIQSPSADSR
ncbi:MAG: aspartyl-tRNA(Asn)/glutamyl-tRNA(Gln) amidotransferase subunit C [Rhodothermales bacterium]|jgi:aspartyl-tRNA(Asn)/glutamyl-tRNA(Gln) amidotransferase subunit C